MEKILPLISKFADATLWLSVVMILGIISFTVVKSKLWLWIMIQNHMILLTISFSSLSVDEAFLLTYNVYSNLLSSSGIKLLLTSRKFRRVYLNHFKYKKRLSSRLDLIFAWVCLKILNAFLIVSCLNRSIYNIYTLNYYIRKDNS